MINPSKTFSCQVFRNGTTDTRPDSVVVEEPLEIRISYHGSGGMTVKNIAVTMRTPGNDAELAEGFLFTEGIISSRDAISKIQSEFDPNIISVDLHPGFEPDLKNTDRNFYTTSSCGVCGKSSIDSVRLKCTPVEPDFRIDASILIGLPDKVRRSQEIFEATGGLHAAALADGNGEIKLLREDVGRHNATDKVIGAALDQKLIPLSRHILMLSGRISFELVQKAALAGIPVVAGVGAPSSLALELAQELNMTVAGFIRESRFNHYCGSHITYK